MATQTLSCPSCGSAVAEPYVETGDLLVCPYCETRYRVVNHKAVSVVPGPQPSKGRELTGGLVAVGLILLLSVVAARVLAMWEDSGGGSGLAGSPAPVGFVGPERAAPEELRQEVPAQAVEAQRALTADFRPNGRLESGKDAYYVLGHVENTSAVTLDQVRVNVVLLDEDGQEVGVDFGYSERSQLAPGEISPVSLLVNQPIPHTDRRYELELRAAAGKLPQAEGLELEALPPTFDRIWGWTFQGTVTNTGTRGATFVKIEVQALDEAGGLVGLATTYAGGDLLEAGATAHFKTSALKTAAEPATFAYAVSGWP